MKSINLRKLVKEAISEILSESSIQDPTKEEMMEFLQTQSGGDDGWQDEAEVAIYWFAHDYHGGQSSNLYSALSTSPYSPGPMRRSVEGEGGMAEMFYEALVYKYGGADMTESQYGAEDDMHYDGSDLKTPNTTEPQPIPQDSDAIAQLIHSLKEGVGIQFFKGNYTSWIAIECRVNGNTYYYPMQSSGEFENKMDLTEEEINNIAKQIPEFYTHYSKYAIGDYTKSRDHYSGEDTQDVGDYEKFGADQPTWSDIRENNGQELLDVSKISNIKLSKVSSADSPKFTDASVESAMYQDDTNPGKLRYLTDQELEWLNDNHPEVIQMAAPEYVQASGEYHKVDENEFDGFKYPKHNATISKSEQEEANSVAKKLWGDGVSATFHSIDKLGGKHFRVKSFGGHPAYKTTYMCKDKNGTWSYVVGDGINSRWVKLNSINEIHPDEIENMGDGYTNDSQRAFAQSQMERPRKNETNKAETLTAQGKTVVMYQHPVFCKSTDACLGDEIVIAKVFDNPQEAQEFVNDNPPTDESGYYIYRPPKKIAAQSTGEADDVPFEEASQMEPYDPETDTFQPSPRERMDEPQQYIITAKSGPETVYFVSSHTQGEKFVPNAISMATPFRNKREAQQKVIRLKARYVGLQDSMKVEPYKLYESVSSLVKQLIREVIQEELGNEQENPMDAYYVEYVGQYGQEKPFTLKTPNGIEKFEYCMGKYPNGKNDIAVYAYRGDVCYGYNAFKKMYNLSNSVSENKENGKELLRPGYLKEVPDEIWEIVDYQKVPVDDILNKYFIGGFNTRQDEDGFWSQELYFKFPKSIIGNEADYERMEKRMSRHHERGPGQPFMTSGARILDKGDYIVVRIFARGGLDI